MLHANTSFSHGLYSSASVLGLYMDCFSASPHSQADSRAGSSSSTSTWVTFPKLKFFTFFALRFLRLF
eukprot:g1056.t1